ncbi:translational machinery component, partial [Fomitiporia mediterranea MF3/22]|uniref:translational machinery component n=1 Tax=Fomitiporia mediterranea (strain MF3/22) TaxID=694068 RepID=UPI0004407F53
NCIMTLTDEQSRWVASWSSGMCGFRNAAEGSYEAGYQCAIHIFEKVREEIKRRSEEVKLEIYLNGFGQGRSALLKALTMSEGDGVREVVSKLTDTTPIRIGGTRLQKARRL